MKKKTEHIGKARKKIWEKQIEEKGLLEKDSQTLSELQREVEGGIRHHRRHRNENRDNHQ